MIYSLFTLILCRKKHIKLQIGSCYLTKIITETGTSEPVPGNKPTDLFAVGQFVDDNHYTFRCDFFMDVEHKVWWFLATPLGESYIQSDSTFNINSKYDADTKIMSSTMKVVSLKKWFSKNNYNYKVVFLTFNAK